MKIDKKELKRTFSVRIDSYSLEKLTKLAKKQGKTVAEVIRTAIKKIL